MYPGLKSRRGKCTAWSIRPNVSTDPAHPGREAQRTAYSFRGMFSIESDRLTGWLPGDVTERPKSLQAETLERFP
jgi:hypothetical protein